MVQVTAVHLLTNALIRTFSTCQFMECALNKLVFTDTSPEIERIASGIGSCHVLQPLQELLRKGT